MARRGRNRGGQSYASKAAVLTDADIMSGTVADAAATKLGDAEQYWLLYKKHPWVRACIRIKGNAVAQEGYDLVAIDGDETLDESDENVRNFHGFLRIGFVGKCNTFRKFRKTIVIDCETFGVAYARRKKAVIDGKKQLVAIERMNPLRLAPHLNADKTAIDYYIVKRAATSTPGDPVSQAAADLTPADQRAQEQIPADEMIVFTLDEGGDDVLPSPSPLEALDMTCAVDFNVRNHRRAMFKNGTQFGNVLVNKTGNEDQVRDAQRKLRLQAGAHNGFRNIAIAGDWDIKNLLVSGGRDFDFIKGSELTLEEICAVYGVPPSKLRDVSGSMGQAGKGEDDEAFEQECILPIEENFYETLTIEVLEKEFGIDYFSIVPARRNKVRLDRFDAATKLVRFGGSGNQALDLVGLPPVEDPKMQVPLFVGATGQNGIQDDEIIQPDPQAQPQGEGDVTDRDEIDNENTDKARGRQLAAKGKGWY